MLISIIKKADIESKQVKKKKHFNRKIHKIYFYIIISKTVKTVFQKWIGKIKPNGITCFMVTQDIQGNKLR